MKNSLYTLLFIVPFLFITSCSDNSVSNTDKEANLAQLEAQYKPIGSKHNNGLRNIRESISEKNISSRSDLFKSVKESGRNYLNGLNNSNTQFSKFNNRFDRQLKFITKPNKKSKTSGIKCRVQAINATEAARCFKVC